MTEIAKRYLIYIAVHLFQILFTKLFMYLTFAAT